RRHDDAAPRAGLDVDVRVDADLADDTEVRQPLEQGRPDRRALAQERQRLRVREARGQRIDVLRVVVPDRHTMVGDLPAARERLDGVLIVVEDRDVHGLASECGGDTRPRERRRVYHGGSPLGPTADARYWRAAIKGSEEASAP